MPRGSPRSRVKPTRHDGVHAEELSVKAAVHDLAFEPERFDVVVDAGAVCRGARRLRRPRHGAARRGVRAGSRATGPSVFAPAHGAAEDIAGQGVANPASMLLAAALMLGEGLGERRRGGDARRAPCSTRAPTASARPTSSRVGVGATTREFADVVLAHLPHAMTDAEFYREAVA